MTNHLAGDEKVVGADWLTDHFKGRPNSAGMLRVFSGEVQDIDGTRQEGSDAFRVHFGSLALGNSVPKLEQHDRRGGDHVTRHTGALETSPDRLRPTIDQRDTGIGVEQIGQSKILREGVVG